MEQDNEFGSLRWGQVAIGLVGLPIRTVARLWCVGRAVRRPVTLIVAACVMVGGMRSSCRRVSRGGRRVCRSFRERTIVWFALVGMLGLF